MMQPLRKHDELVDEINATIKRFGSIDDVSMKRIGKKIASLEIKNYGEACFCWMMLYGAKSDKQNFLKYQKIAEQHGFNDYLDNLNYASGFANVGLTFTALNYARTSYQIVKLPETIGILRSLAYDSGRFKESLGYWLELKKMNKDDGIEINKTEEIVSFMDKNSISDDDVSSIVKLAEDILHDSNVKIQLSSCYPDYDDQSLSISFSINTMPLISSYLNVALADKIAESISDTRVISKVSLDFVGNASHAESTHPIFIRKINSGNNERTLNFSPALVLKPYIDDESNLIVIEDDELNIHAYAINRETLEQELSPELFLLWDEYAQEKPENLTPKAQILRNKLLARCTLESR